MVEAIIGWMLVAWLAWVAACCAVFVLGALAPKPRSWPHYDGFRIVMPESLREVLSPEEFEAVRQHEEGHRRRMHPWLNLAGACLLFPASREALDGQEMEADDCARDKLALARAIRKLSGAPFDRMRAARLERGATILAGQSGHPPAGSGDIEGRCKCTRS